MFLFYKLLSQYINDANWRIIFVCLFCFPNPSKATVLAERSDGLEVISCFAVNKRCFFEVGRKSKDRSHHKLVGVNFSEHLITPVKTPFIEKAARNRLLKRMLTNPLRHQFIINAVYRALYYELTKLNEGMATEEYLLKITVFNLLASHISE